MKFADPLWFLLMIPLALLYGARHWSGKFKPVSLPFSDLPLLKTWVSSASKYEAIIEWLKIAGMILMIVALARPQKINRSVLPPKPVIDIMLCMDTSISMAALDFDPDNRLEAAKKAAVDFIKKRPMDRMGLVVFGGEALLQCPLTLDHETLTEFIKSIELHQTRVEGTAIGTAIALGASRLSEAQAKSKVMILLTDGRSNRGSIDPKTAAQAAKDLGIKIYTIGCAVPGGGQIPDLPQFNVHGGQLAEDLDETTLSAIADETGAKYYRVTSMKKFNEIYREIDQLEKTKIKIDETTQVEDQYLPILILALVIFTSAFGLKYILWRTVP